MDLYRSGVFWFHPMSDVTPVLIDFDPNQDAVVVIPVPFAVEKAAIAEITDLCNAA
jgi:hypothetical protein